MAKRTTKGRRRYVSIFFIKWYSGCEFIGGQDEDMEGTDSTIIYFATFFYNIEGMALAGEGVGMFSFFTYSCIIILIFLPFTELMHDDGGAYG